MSDAFQLYLQRCNLSSRTRTHFLFLYDVLANACPTWSVDEFETFLAKKSQEVGAAALNKYISCMRKIVEWKKLDFPNSVFKRFKESPKTKVTFSDKETEAFLSVPKLKWMSEESHLMYTMFWKVCAYMGMRPGEVASLQVQHIDFTSQSITIPRSKTGSGRTIRIPEILGEEFLAYTKTCSSYLFLTVDTKQPVTSVAWAKDFSRRLSYLKIDRPLTPYSFRHTLATNLLQNGAGLFPVQDILGHTDPKTTRMYYHGDLKSQDKAFQKDPRVRRRLPPRVLIEHLVAEIDQQDLLSVEGVDYMKILEARKLLFESLKT